MFIFVKHPIEAVSSDTAVEVLKVEEVPMDIRKVRLFRELYLEGKYPLYWSLEQVRLLEEIRVGGNRKCRGDVISVGK